MNKKQNKPARAAHYTRFASLEAYYKSCGVSVKEEGAVPQGRRAWLYGRAAVGLDAMTALGRQHGQTARRAEGMGYGIVGLSEDRGTGRSLDRPGLEEMRQAAREHRFDVLFVHGASRLSRDMLLAVELIRGLKNLGVQVYAVKEHMWLTENPLLDLFMDAQWAPAETGPGFTQNM